MGGGEVTLAGGLGGGRGGEGTDMSIGKSVAMGMPRAGLQGFPVHCPKKSQRI